MRAAQRFRKRQTEKRKVDSSILSLTTSCGLVSSALTSANAYCALWCLQLLSDHDWPCVTVGGRSLSHVDRTSRSPEASLDAHALLAWNSPRDRLHCAGDGPRPVRAGSRLALVF
jgi:hypothetical protein